MNILLKRAGALGDVILTTPIARRLRAENPDALIHVETGAPIVYQRNPYVNAVMSRPLPGTSYDRIVDLNDVYEMRPKMHIIDAYMLAAFGDTIGDKSTFLAYPTRASPDLQAAVNWPRTITIHAGVAWRNRTFSSAFWYTVIDALIAAGYNVITVGGTNDFSFGEKSGLMNAVGRTPLDFTTGVIAMSACFIGIDSALIHAAGATITPIIGLFTCAKAEYRAPFRNGQPGYNFVGLSNILDCLGCLHDYPPPVTYIGCRRGDFACVDPLPVDLIVAEVQKFVPLRASSSNT